MMSTPIDTTLTTRAMQMFEHQLGIIPVFDSSSGGVARVVQHLCFLSCLLLPAVANTGALSLQTAGSKDRLTHIQA